MIEWIFSIGIVLAAVALFIGIFIFSAKSGLSFNEFMGLVLLVIFIIVLICGVHETLYGGGK
jgi:hypothetical membrane protein